MKVGDDRGQEAGQGIDARAWMRGCRRRQEVDVHALRQPHPSRQSSSVLLHPHLVAASPIPLLRDTHNIHRDVLG